MLQFVVDMTIRAIDLALIAVGLSTVYSLIRFPNVALVQYSVVGAFTAILLQNVGVPLWLACVISALFVGALALAFNVLIFERLLRTSSVVALIGSLALGMVLSAIFLLAFGPSAFRFDVTVSPAMRFGGARISTFQIIAIGIAAAAMVALAVFLFRTPLGREMRAVSANEELAEASGIDARRVTNVVVFISGVFAALGGITLALKSSVDINLGNDMLLPVFAAAIVGGLGNPMGALAGAFVIAAAETFVTNINYGFLTDAGFYYLPASYASAASFAILVAILLIRPQGLFVSGVSRV